MQEAASHKSPENENGAPFTSDHGVNPGWGVYEKRPVIPAFNGVAEIGKLALMFTLWSRVEDFLYRDVGIEPLDVAKEEKKHLAILLESETYLIALLCLLNNEHYSAGGLVDAMFGVDATADQRGNARKRILNRTLPIVGDRYGLIDYSERHMGNSMEYSICRSERLVEFAELHLVPAIGNIIGTQPDELKKPPVKKALVKKAAARKRPVKKTPVNSREGKKVLAKKSASASDNQQVAKTRKPQKVPVRKTATTAKAPAKTTTRRKTVSNSGEAG